MPSSGHLPKTISMVSLHGFIVVSCCEYVSGMGLVEIVPCCVLCLVYVDCIRLGERASSLPYVCFATGLEFEFVDPAVMVRILLFTLVSQFRR